MSSGLQLSSLAFDTLRDTLQLDLCIADLDGNIRYSSSVDNNTKYHNEIRRFLSDPVEHNEETNSQMIPIHDGNQLWGYLYCMQPLAPDKVQSILLYFKLLFSYETERTRLDDALQADSALVSRLINGDPADFGPNIETLASQLGYRIAHPMAVVAVLLTPRFNYCLNINLGYEIAVDKLKKDIIHTLREHLYFNHQDIFAFVNEDYFVVVKNIEEINDRKRLYEMLLKCAEALDQILIDYKVFEYRIAVGRIVDSYRNCHLSFHDASAAIDYASKLQLSGSIVHPSDILCPMLSDNLPETLYCEKIEPAVKALQAESGELVLSLFECFNYYINHGFSISDTATQLYFHRNTVRKRLEKLHRITGFDPNGGFIDILFIQLIYSQYIMQQR